MINYKGRYIGGVDCCKSNDYTLIVIYDTVEKRYLPVTKLKLNSDKVIFKRNKLDL